MTGKSFRSESTLTPVMTGAITGALACLPSDLLVIRTGLKRYIHLELVVAPSSREKFGFG